ncbi:MAG: serine protease inhibitor [Renibacterium salmoninarum]|nr:serine protease inhibitor [Renibacterium salmoninarum]
MSILVKATPQDAGKATMLTCSGSTPLENSSVADPAAACAAVQKFGSSMFSPTVPNRQCTMQYGGPQTAQVRGMVNGASVDRSFSLTDGCEIADWNRFAAILDSSADGGL